MILDKTNWKERISKMESLSPEETIKLLDQYDKLPFEVKQKDKLIEELNLTHDIADNDYNNIKFLGYIFKLSEKEISLMLDKLIDTAQEKAVIEGYENRYSDVLKTIEAMRPVIEANRSTRATQDNLVGDPKLNDNFLKVLKQIETIQSMIEKKKQDPKIEERKKEILDSIENGKRHVPTIINKKPISRLKTYSKGKVV